MSTATRQSVLVTGAGGFIGSHLAADQARRGRRVVAIDLHPQRVQHLHSPGSFDVIEGDFTDPDVQTRVLKDVDTVFHLAAAHLSVATGEAEYRRVNVEGVRSLLEGCGDTGVRRLVHCSTIGVHGRIEHPPANEDSPCRPTILYEQTKLEGERVISESGRGIPTVVLRPVWVYGPGCPRTEKLFRTIAKRRFFVAGRGLALRHCVYIRDMLDAFELAATKDEAVGEVIIVGDAGAVTVRQVLQEIANVCGVRSPRSVPMWLLYAVGLAAELGFKPLRREPPLSRRTLKFFTANTSFDISRARRLLDFEPRYDLAAGMRETYQLLKAGAHQQLPLPDVPTGFCNGLAPGRAASAARAASST